MTDPMSLTDEAARAVKNIHGDPQKLAAYTMQRCGEFVYDTQREDFIRAMFSALRARLAPPPTLAEQMKDWPAERIAKYRKTLAGLVDVDAPSPPTCGNSIIKSIEAEVARATRKFPTWPTDPIHAANVVMEEAGELAKAVLEHTYEPHKSSLDDVRAEATETAAMAVRFLMSLAQYKFVASDQHRQGEGS